MGLESVRYLLDHDFHLEAHARIRRESTMTYGIGYGSALQ